MTAFEDRERGWRISGRPARLGATAWVLAVAVVGAIAAALYLLHG